MIKLFFGYIKALESYADKNRRILETGLILITTAIAGIYINLFTSSNGMEDFWGINLTTLGEVWFMLAFGLIALLSLLKAIIAIAIIGIIGFVSSFVLYVISVNQICWFIFPFFICFYLIQNPYCNYLSSFSSYSNKSLLFFLSLINFCASSSSYGFKWHVSSTKFAYR